MSKPALIFLSHRIPYPPNKGDKIRSYHLLRFLSTRYEVHLGTFVDDQDDWQYVPELERLCTDLCVVGLSPRRQRLKSLGGIWRGEPLSLSYYRNGELASWVHRKVYGDRIRRFVAFSSQMAQYAPANGVDVNQSHRLRGR